MLTTSGNHKQVFFLGQNSHGTAEPWEYRTKLISSVNTGKKIAVVIECPTVDMLLYEIKKETYSGPELRKSLMMSPYWWVRSAQFFRFLSLLPTQAHLFGVDIPFEILNHNHFMSKLRLSRRDKYEMAGQLLEVDVTNKASVAELSYTQREDILHQKLRVILRCEYAYVFVICHNFHASKHSWLPFHSLCQRILSEKDTGLAVTSVGSFSRQMEFISTDGDRGLNRHKLNGSLRALSDSVYEVKMVSSLYRNELSDALPLTVSIPMHFDEIVVWESESAVSMEGWHA
ncbi:hypothetical protein QM201_25275 [Enterobacter asburiae]|nr:hypothetical protein [Enterobacter asburiae]